MGEYNLLRKKEMNYFVIRSKQYGFMNTPRTKIKRYIVSYTTGLLAYYLLYYLNGIPNYLLGDYFPWVIQALFYLSTPVVWYLAFQVTLFGLKEEGILKFYLLTIGAPLAALLPLSFAMRMIGVFPLLHSVIFFVLLITPLTSIAATIGTFIYLKKQPQKENEDTELTQKESTYAFARYLFGIIGIVSIALFFPILGFMAYGAFEGNSDSTFILLFYGVIAGQILLFLSCIALFKNMVTRYTIGMYLLGILPIVILASLFFS